MTQREMIQRSVIPDAFTASQALLCALTLFAGESTVAAETLPTASVRVDAECGGEETTASLLAALRAREYEIDFSSFDEQDRTSAKWSIAWTGGEAGECDIVIARSDAMLRLKNVDPLSGYGLQAATVQILWVLDADRRVESGPLPLPGSSAPHAAPPVDALTDQAATEVPTRVGTIFVASVTADLTSLNARAHALLGAQLEVLQFGSLRLHLAVVSALPRPGSRRVFRGTSSGAMDSPALAVIAGGLGLAWSKPVFRKSRLNVPVRLGFMRASEDFSDTAFATQPSTTSNALWTEALVELEFQPNAVRVAVGGGFRLVGPLDNIGPERFGLSGFLLRLRLGVGTST